ncbi:MAG: carbohydrate kinase [Niabella sp.]|nr:carbohydrate kinase [Niabella sp.]
MMTKNNEVVCFGEILWDVLPGRELPGGAPMNVTYHLSKLGHKATLISRLGADERGMALRKVFNDKGIDTRCVQTDPDHKTSVVLATPNEAGDVKYDIVEDVAWDYIERQPVHEELVSNARYFVFGSLAARSKITRDTLFALMELPSRKVLDINLRVPFINRVTIEYLLGKAEVVKMNEEELALVAGWYGDYLGIEEKMYLLQEQFNIETLIVTRGAKGAVINYDNKFYVHDGFKVPVADTIGSGDSFLAAFLSKFIENKNVGAALTFACTVGAFVATKEGGCPDYDVGAIELFQNKLSQKI